MPEALRPSGSTSLMQARCMRIVQALNRHTRTPRAILCWMLMAGTPLSTMAADTFVVTAILGRVTGRVAPLTVSFSLPSGYHLYADSIRIEPSAGIGIAPLEMPKPVLRHDASGDSDRAMFERGFTVQSILSNLPAGPFTVTVQYQGCSESSCFLPVNTVFPFAAPGTSVPAAAPEEPQHGQTNWAVCAAGFDIAATEAGYMTVERFLSFLDHGRAGNRPSHQNQREPFMSRGTVIPVLAIIAGGVMLNLTPCVLPLVPLTLGVLGIGAGTRSRSRSFLVGTAYGAGMAAAYGAAGVAVVLTGSRFGAVNGSAWFNFSIASLFAVLSLAMFGVFSIDFTRYRPAVSRPRHGSLAAAAALGSVTALLAGACVAPVVLQVLIMSADFHARGMAVGLLLPFALGVGMALPWPFAAAGLSFLPAPGRWTVWIKDAFGIVLLATAVWYGVEGMRLARGTAVLTHDALWQSSLPEALVAAKAQRLPVLLDFSASWCKTCRAMDATTLKDTAVRARLARFIAVRFPVEHPNEPAVRGVLDHFGVMGLPTYVILHPRD